MAFLLFKSRKEQRARAKELGEKRRKKAEKKQLADPGVRKHLREKSKKGEFSKADVKTFQKEGIIPKKEVKTKGGTYEVHAKGGLEKAKAAGEIKQTFGEAFKSNCKGKAADHTFSWTSPSRKKNSYSCKKG